jgi:hypothetical protein
MPTLFDSVSSTAWTSFMEFTKVGFESGWQKSAAPDSDFEQSFFQLAYQQLQDKLGNLLPYLIGFETVNKSDDGSKALGVFGFRSNNGQILYVPVFFINGSVKGLDLLYSKNHSQFYPLNEDFADMFLKDDSSGLGEASQETRESIQKDMPTQDMRDIVRPPRTGKYTYASVKADESPLLDFVRHSGRNVKKAFYNMMSNSPAYMQELLKFYPMDKIAESVAGMDVVSPGKDYRKDSDIIPSKSDDIEVIEPKSPKAKDLSLSQKETLLTQGYIIIDKRPDQKKSQFGVMKFVEKFGNPNDTGFYPYVTTQGTIRLGLILLRPMQLQQHFATSDSIIVDLNSTTPGQAYLVDAEQVYVKDQIHIKDFGSVLKMFTDINEVKPSFGDTYVLINEKLRCSTPFRVVSSVKEPDGVRRIRIELYHQYCDQDEFRLGQRMVKEERAGSARSLPKEDNKYEKVRPAKHLTLVVTKQQGDRLTIQGDLVYVPAGFKVLNLNFGDPSYGAPITAEDAETRGEKRRSIRDEWEAGKPGRRSALVSTMYEKNVLPLTVRSNGSDYFADIADFKKNYANVKMAKIGMVLDFGLGVKEAAELIDGLAVKKQAKGYIKMAYMGDTVPWYQDEVPYNDEFGHPTTTGIGQEFPQPVDQSYQEDPSETNMGRGSRNDPHAGDEDYQSADDSGGQGGGISQDVNHAVQLAQGGQKSIFDCQSIATLAKYVSPSDKITEYTPYLVSALDRLGRILFLCHWESDKFSEVYGRSDMPQLVELLTSVFKNLGDLIIFLKRKSPELSINMSNQDGLET